MDWLTVVTLALSVTLTAIALTLPPLLKCHIFRVLRDVYAPRSVGKLPVSYIPVTVKLLPKILIVLPIVLLSYWQLLILNINSFELPLE